MEIKPEKIEINAHKKRIESRDNIKTTINLVWLSIGLSAFTELLNIWGQLISPGRFVTSIMLMGIFCIIPYKLSKGSNGARYVYAVLCGISVLYILSGIDIYQTKIDVAFSFIQIPINLYVLIKLFSEDASGWFHGKNRV